MNSTLLLLCVVLIVQQAYVIFITHSHTKERKELLDRIMAKDYKELKAFKEQPKGDRKNLPNPVKKSMQEELKRQGLLK